MSADAFGVPLDQATLRDVIVRADSQTYSLPRRADFESNLREALRSAIIVDASSVRAEFVQPHIRSHQLLAQPGPQW